MRHALTWFLWSILAANAVPARCADDGTETTQGDQRSGQRLKIMRNAIDGFRIASSEIEPESSLKFSSRPMLRYNDAARGSGGAQHVLDAAIWRLGETGRPKAVVTLEICVFDKGYSLLTYEFVSLTSQKFDMKSTRGVRWLPHGTDLSMVEIDGAPAPADTPRARLVQMRALARRFTAQEKLGDQKTDLRLLPQPIDRYDDSAAGILDGAVFIFAHGTNPEMGLLLECSDKRWSYGAFRLASAKLLAQFDGKWFLQSTMPPGYSVDAPYTATRHAISLPEEDDGG